MGQGIQAQPVYVAVLRSSSDRTNGGISSKHDRLLVVLPGQVPPEDATTPVMVLERWGQGVRMRPLEAPRGFPGQVVHFNLN